MHRERRKRFPRHRLHRKPPDSDPGMHHGTCVTHACATRNFTYLARGPWSRHDHIAGTKVNINGRRHSHVVVIETETGIQSNAVITRSNIYTIVWFLRAPRWYIGPTAMPRAAIGCDSRPRHCISLLPLDLTMYHRFIRLLRVVQSREGR